MNESKSVTSYKAHHSISSSDTINYTFSLLEVQNESGIGNIK